MEEEVEVTDSNVHHGGNFFEDLIIAFQDSYEAGEPWLFLIATSFLIGVAITIERWIKLKQYSIDGASFMFEVQKYVLSNDIDGAIRVCSGASKAVLPQVVKAGLQRASCDVNQIQNAVDAKSLEVVPKLEKRLHYLGLVANIATLLGLLGTIVGLIKAFKAVGAADPAQRQAILSAGISEAMSATATGLMTAIFAMIAHGLLSSRSTKLLEEVDEFGVKLLDILSVRQQK